MLIRQIFNKYNPILNTRLTANFAQDWSHVYNGIYKF